MNFPSNSMPREAPHLFIPFPLVGGDVIVHLPTQGRKGLRSLPQLGHGVSTSGSHTEEKDTSSRVAYVYQNPY